jgi:hypothetical protein
LTYGFYENYLIGLHQFAQRLDDTILDLQQKNESSDGDDNDGEFGDSKVLDKFFNRLKIKLTECIEDTDIKTLDYIRFRRNRITHGTKKTQGKILEIINNHGRVLNIHWDKKLRKGRYKIDFTIKNVDNFDGLELFDIMNIFRKITERIDTAVIEKLGLKRLSENAIVDFLEKSEKDIRGFDEKRKKEKFRSYFQSEYGHRLSDYELEEIKLTVV